MLVSPRRSEGPQACSIGADVRQQVVHQEGWSLPLALTLVLPLVLTLVLTLPLTLTLVLVLTLTVPLRLRTTTSRGTIQAASMTVPWTS